MRHTNIDMYVQKREEMKPNWGYEFFRLNLSKSIVFHQNTKFEFFFGPALDLGPGCGPLVRPCPIGPGPAPLASKDVTSASGGGQQDLSLHLRIWPMYCENKECLYINAINCSIFN